MHAVMETMRKYTTIPKEKAQAGEIRYHQPIISSRESRAVGQRLSQRPEIAEARKMSMSKQGCQGWPQIGLDKPQMGLAVQNVGY